MASTVLEVKDIYKSYGDLEVLKGISFDIKKGDVKVIFGPSGSGKSTLLRCINMLDPPDSGEVYLQGEQITDRSKDINKMRSRIGFVFQHFNLFAHLRAIDNIAIGPHRVLGMTQEEARDRAMDALEQVHLKDRADHYPGELSGGQKQRVGIARALAMKPEVVLFDEPTSALDPELIGEVLEVMLEIARGGTTMFVVTHEMGFARAVSSEMMFIDEGVIVERGTPQHFFENPNTERAKQFLKRLEVLYGESKKQ